jgi:peptide/nickel transport system substrate-binding protein
MLLFGEVLSAVLDPFPYWHSTQVKDPGLNLASYKNSAVDNLLEKARTSVDEEIRTEQYQQIQDLIIEDAPAIFLYTPEYIYMTSEEVTGPKERTIFDPSQRFSNIEEWYIKTKRTWQ